MVGDRRHGARHRALADRAAVPARHTRVHADRHPAHARARLRVRDARLLRGAGRPPGRPRAAPDAAGQARLQPRAVRARHGRADRHRSLRRVRRPGLRVDDLGRRARGDADRRRADDRADPRRDVADRGLRLARSGAPDVRHGPRGHDHRHDPGARRRHPLDRAAGGDAAAADPDPGRDRGVPGVRARARRPREGGLPRRDQPHPVRLARGRRRARGPARGCARSLPRRAGRGHPVRRRRRGDTADRARPGPRPRVARARGRRDRRRAADVRGRLRGGGGADGAVPRHARSLPRAARRPPRPARRVARRGSRDRHDHAREPLRPRARLHGRRPRAVRDADRQRERRAAVRPPRAGRRRAARPAGPAPAPGPPRPAHRARQPLAVHPAGPRGAAAHTRARSP